MLSVHEEKLQKIHESKIWKGKFDGNSHSTLCTGQVHVSAIMRIYRSHCSLLKPYILKWFSFLNIRETLRESKVRAELH